MTKTQIPQENPPADAASGAVATLFPGYFALVMATGIVSIAAGQQDLEWLAKGLYIVAAVGYVVLVILTVMRIAVYWGPFTADLTSHAKGFAFLTIVAGTNVLGSASGIVYGWWTLAWTLWWFSIAAWAVLMYSTVIAVIMRSPKPDMGAGINGTWFLIIVSTQSIAVLGALLLTRHPSDILAFLLVAAFLLGIVLYLIVMTLVFLRWAFFELKPSDATPPAWIAAGAVAITVLAGSNLLGARDVSPRLAYLSPALEAFVMLAWATATFWFPVMVAMGIWRHIVNRIPITYNPAYWALVFPIGMYGASTFKMLGVTGLDSLQWLPQATLIAALVAWAATFFGLAHLGLRTVTKRS